jgi:hypothetical protein
MPNIACSTTSKTLISEKYGVHTIETNPSSDTTKQYVELLYPQIKHQGLSEIIRPFDVPKFFYGLRWGCIDPENSNLPTIHHKDIINIKQFDKNNRYAYTRKDQFGHILPDLDRLSPIIREIENSLQLDMSDYDAVIGNIYLPGLYIPAHKDTSESATASKYPIIVYTIGNDSSLGIWTDDGDGKVVNNYPEESYVYSNLGAPNKEVTTKNGTIYTMGHNCNNRYELLHATPCNSMKPKMFPEIQLPDNDFISHDLRNKTLTNYTITLTFRRVQDIKNGVPESPRQL